MSRPTASPPPNEASGPNGDHRASQATTTSVKRCPRAAVLGLADVRETGEKTLFVGSEELEAEWEAEQGPADQG